MYGIYAENGAVVVGGQNGVNFQNGLATIDTSGNFRAYGNVWINGSWLNSSSTLYIGGASGAAVTMYMNGNVNPISDKAYGLGSGPNRWAGISAITGYFSSIDCSGLVHGGGGSGDAFKIGDDCYLVDINSANRIGVQGAQDRSQGGFEFGSGTGMFLYRDGSYLRSSAGFVTSGNLSYSPINTTYRACYLDSSNRIGYNMSSVRFKDNINTVEDCSWLYNLRPVTFEWKDQERQKLEGTQLGLIAEEVNKECPQLTWLDSEGKPEGVHYEWLGVPLIVELKKLRTEVTDLRHQIKQLAANKGD